MRRLWMNVTGALLVYLAAGLVVSPVINRAFGPTEAAMVCLGIVAAYAAHALLVEERWPFTSPVRCR